MSTEKTCLVTGANQGIGLDLVKKMIQAGWKVIGTARQPDKADKLKELNPYKVIQLDISDETSIQAAATACEGIPIDILINNAGMGHISNVSDSTKQQIMESFEVNAVGPFLVTKAFRSNLKAAVDKSANHEAYVMNTSSTIGSLSENLFPGAGVPYRSSKTALNMLSLSLAEDMKKDGINVFLLCPGYVSTNINNYSGVLTVDDCSNAIMNNLLTKLTPDFSGKWYSHEGKIIAW